MTMATVAGSIEIPGRRFGKMTIDLEIPGGSFDQYPRAAQRLLVYLWRASEFGKEEVHKTTEEIARACGRSVRWVYKALRQCLDHMEGEGEGATRTPLIEKRFIKGPREAAGRVLKLLLKFARPKKEKKAAGGKARAKGGATAAAASAAPAPASPAPAPDEGPEPELDEETRQILEESRRRREAEKAKAEAKARLEAKAEAARATAGGGVQSPSGPRKLTQDDLKAQLEIVRGRTRPSEESPDPKPRE